jgi:hypothetical protein
MKQNVNTNCLADVECPRCSSQGPFRIKCTALMDVEDDGVDDYRDVGGVMPRTANAGNATPTAAYCISALRTVRRMGIPALRRGGRRG